MRALLATYTGAGHVIPMSRLRDRLVAAGHEATLLSADAVDGGVRYATVPPPPAGQFEENLAAYEEIGFGPALATEVRDVALALGADVVLADALVPSALCGAHASGAAAVSVLNLPYGRLRSELSAGTGWWSGPLSTLNATRSALGLDPYRSPLASIETAASMLLLGIPDLEDPGTSVPTHLRFVGPCLPRVPTAAAEGPRPTVVVALSSSDMGHHDSLQSILGSLAAMDVAVVATTGGVIDRGTLDVPDNCEVHDWLPLPEAFAGASAVVTHAGHGTVMAALATGSPLVCVPLGRDQPFTAARIEALGAGLIATPTTVPGALRDLLADDGYRTAAAQLRARIRSLATAAEDALAGLV
jgi:UDP:flavonoid glycosyltransferase YjiC (YdhE family)